MGEAVARLPPKVARLRISGDANSGSHSRIIARPASSLSATPAPIAISCGPSETPWSSANASTLTRCSNRRPRKFDSTARSVAPATSRAFGWSRRISRHSRRLPGRENPGTRKAPNGGAGFATRVQNRSSAGGPTVASASRMGRYPVQRHKLPPRLCGSHAPTRPGRYCSANIDTMKPGVQ